MKIEIVITNKSQAGILAHAGIDMSTIEIHAIQKDNFIDGKSIHASYSL